MKNLWTKLKGFLKEFFQPRIETKESFKNDINIKFAVYVVATIAALALSIVNLVFYLRNTPESPGYGFMMITTLVLAGICLICALITRIFKNRLIPEILIALAVCGIFSYYALASQNEGFAILWIIIVPAVSMLLLSFKMGLIVSTYFLIFIIIVFYSPVKGYLVQMQYDFPHNPPEHMYYNDQFLIRFPLLYATAYFVSILLAGQKVFYLNKSQKNAYFDVMTNLKNRRYYNEFVANLNEKKLDLDLTIVSVDINILKIINDIQGHDRGDEAIIKTGEIISEVFKNHTDDIFRTGGDEFFAFFYDKKGEINQLIERVNAIADETKVGDIKLSISIGYVKSRDYIEKNIYDLINIAETNMYRIKDDFYKTSKIKKRYEEE